MSDMSTHPIVLHPDLDTDDTRVKIEYDFYYIKHCSLALDLFIVLRTLQTMLTGFGAR